MIPALIRRVFITPSLRMIWLIAKVRIRRLVQNGMVIRNSHAARALGGRVAMNHAVGKPTRKVSTVVMKLSSTDRQKIVRLPSASFSVSSKMSRSNSTPVQPSSEKFHSIPPYWPGERKE